MIKEIKEYTNKRNSNMLLDMKMITNIIKICMLSNVVHSFKIISLQIAMKLIFQEL